MSIKAPKLILRTSADTIVIQQPAHPHETSKILTAQQRTDPASVRAAPSESYDSAIPHIFVSTFCMQHQQLEEKNQLFHHHQEQLAASSHCTRHDASSSRCFRMVSSISELSLSGSCIQLDAGIQPIVRCGDTGDTRDWETNLSYKV